MIWPDQQWIGWIFIILAAVVLLSGVRIDGVIIRVGGPRWRSAMNWYLVVASIAALVAFASVVGYYIDASRGPILWDFDSGNAPLGVSRRFGGPLWIDAIQITGRNRSADPISLENAFVRSDLTNRKLQLKYVIDGDQVSLDHASIIPQGTFILVSVLPSTDENYSQGVVVDEFRAEFERFTFVVEYGGQKVVRRFSSSEVDEFLAQADRETRENLNRPLPGIRDGVVRNRS